MEYYIESSNRIRGQAIRRSVLATRSERGDDAGSKTPWKAQKTRVDNGFSAAKKSQENERKDQNMCLTQNY